MVDEDHLRADELAVRGGSWSAMLFENPHLGIEPQLFWAFTFELGEITRHYGTTPCSLTVDWVSLAVGDWRSMPRTTITGDEFGDPIESSVYFFEHHRFDQVALEIVEQRDRQLHVTADVEGDIDGLGLDRVTGTAWLGFEGITIALAEPPTSLDDATALLGAFTSTEWLRQDPTAPTYFTPSSSHPRHDLPREPS